MFVTSRFLYQNHRTVRRIFSHKGQASGTFVSCVKGKIEKRVQLSNQRCQSAVNIEESVEIRAERDKVWEVISDLSKEKEYWHSIKEVKVISQNKNVIEREVFQNFIGGRVLQKVIFHPKNSIEFFNIKGSMKGSKVLFIEPVKEGITKLTAAWNVRLGLTFLLFSPMVKKHIKEGTVNALRRIKAVCEGREEKVSEVE